MDYCTVGTSTCYPSIERGWWDDVSILVYVGCAGVMGSMWLTAVLWHYCVGKEPVCEDSDEEEEDVPYEKLHLDEVREILGGDDVSTLDKEAMEALAFSHLREETPRGEAVILYNSSTESFWWFADSKSMPSNYLDTLARKYVLAYDCPTLYCDQEVELQKKEEAAARAKAEAEKAEAEKAQDDGAKPTESKDEKTESVFASLKSYNTQKGPTRVPLKEAEPAPDRANRFSYRGKLADWEELQKAREVVFVPHEEESEKMDFATFKKMQEESEGTNPEKIVL